MCGVAGWFSPAPVDGGSRSVLEKMLGQILHRGPDGNGCLIAGHAALAHCRLSIIDISSGRQPMTDSSGTIAIVYNGEIYNYRELRQDLLTRGHVFRTESDTEVILANYLARGTGGFSRLRGMFAFALWDGRTNRALLVRDGSGIKPMFYHVAADGELIFASEAKAILQRMDTAVSLQEDALHQLLNFRYLPRDATLFRGIRQLAPGTVLQWEPKGDIRYLTFDAPRPDGAPGTLELLRDSVRAHLTADVEVGAYLSGGIDSAAIVALAAKYNDDIRTFTLDVGDDPGEAANAARSAELLGVENHCYPQSGNVVETLAGLIWHLEVPKINALQTAEVARHASRQVKVVLSGLGGDELFLGYNLHGWLYRLRQLHAVLPAPAGRLISAAGLRCLRSQGLPVWSEQERALRLPGRLGDWPAVYGLLRNIWDAPGLRSRIYGPRMLDSELSDAHEVLRANWTDTNDPVADAARFEWRQKMVNDLLWHEDRCSMAYGLEVRVPFVDPYLKAGVDALRLDELMPSGEKKGYLRAMLRDTLPATILRRPKSGFQVNAPEFFRTRLAASAGQYLNREAVIRYGLFNPDFVAEVSRYKNARRFRWHYFMLYFMLMSHMWIDIFETGALPAAPLNTADR